MSERIKSGSPLLWVNTIIVFITFHSAIPIFINSTYLSTFASDKIVGLIYSVGSILTIFSLILTSRYLGKFGNYRTTLTLVFIEILALMGLVIFRDFLFIIPVFLIHFILSTVISFNADIFLENFTQNTNTGETRGLTYTFSNLGWFIAPLLAGFLLSGGDKYWIIYATSIVFIAPIIFLLVKYFKDFKDPIYHKMSFFKDMKIAFRNKDRRNIFLSSFMLKLFFAWMVIYTPLYLHQVMGFNFTQIGLAFTLMMLAYILFELPLGIVADKYIGEKEILVAGFVVIAIATSFLSFITIPNIFIWIIALFLTRVGAAMIEITTESYFFKEITSADTDDISFWRMLRPVGYLVAPLLASFGLLFFEFKYIFLAIGIIMLLGLNFALRIKDTK